MMAAVLVGGHDHWISERGPHEDPVWSSMAKKFQRRFLKHFYHRDLC